MTAFSRQSRPSRPCSHATLPPPTEQKFRNVGHAAADHAVQPAGDADAARSGGDQRLDADPRDPASEATVLSQPDQGSTRVRSGGGQRRSSLPAPTTEPSSDSSRRSSSPISARSERTSQPAPSPGSADPETTRRRPGRVFAAAGDELPTRSPSAHRRRLLGHPTHLLTAASAARVSSQRH